MGGWAGGFRSEWTSERVSGSRGRLKQEARSRQHYLRRSKPPRLIFVDLHPQYFAKEHSKLRFSDVSTIKGGCEDNYCHELGSDQSVTLIIFTKRFTLGPLFHTKKEGREQLSENLKHRLHVFHHTVCPPPTQPGRKTGDPAMRASLQPRGDKG